MYFEFLFLRAHSRRRVERKYWSGESLYSRTTCSNSVTVGIIGPMGSGFPQLGLPRRLAMKIPPRSRDKMQPTSQRVVYMVRFAWPRQRFTPAPKDGPAKSTNTIWKRM